MKWQSLMWQGGVGWRRSATAGGEAPLMWSDSLLWRRSKGWVPFTEEHGSQINPWPLTFRPPANRWAKPGFTMQKDLEVTPVPPITVWLVFGRQRKNIPRTCCPTKRWGSLIWPPARSRSDDGESSPPSKRLLARDEGRRCRRGWWCVQ